MQNNLSNVTDQTKEYFYKKPFVQTNLNVINYKNFLNGVENARNILESLEKSIEKTKKLERRLFFCKSSHPHRHADGASESNSCRDIKEYRDGQSHFSDNSEKCFRSQVDLAESWSTMSIVCLQYQYEELTKRYASLLHAYDDRGNTLNAREESLIRIKNQARIAYAKLAHAHHSLIAVGDKYLALADKMNERKQRYSENMKRIKNSLRSVLLAAERTRLELDSELVRMMAAEENGNTAILLGEIRKCNRLCLENLRLKSKIEELAPGQINWDEF